MKTPLLLVLRLLLAGAALAPRPTLYVDLGDPRLPVPAPTYAGAADVAGVWNALGPLDGDWDGYLGPRLVDALTGAPTGVRVRVSLTGTFPAGSFLFDDPFTEPPDEALVDDLVDLGQPGSRGSLAVEGLPAGWYRVHTSSFAPDDPAFRTRVAVDGAIDGARSVGGRWPGEPRLGTFASHRVLVVASAPLVVRGTAEVGYGSFSGLQIVPIDAPPAVGASQCGPANLNSTGASATISAWGSAAASDADLALLASSLPSGQPGMFLVGDAAVFVPFVGGSQGNLCVGGVVGRFVEQLGPSSAGGTLGMELASLVLPTSPPSVVQPGETWIFQAWFRDRNPRPTSNFTDAVAVPFR